MKTEDRQCKYCMNYYEDEICIDSDYLIAEYCDLHLSMDAKNCKSFESSIESEEE